MKKILFILIAVFFFSAQSKYEISDTETIEVSAFSKLIVHARCEVILLQADAYEIGIEANDDIRSQIQVNITDNTLRITSDYQIKWYEKC